MKGIKSTLAAASLIIAPTLLGTLMAALVGSAGCDVDGTYHDDNETLADVGDVQDASTWDVGLDISLHGVSRSRADVATVAEATSVDAATSPVAKAPDVARLAHESSASSRLSALPLTGWASTLVRHMASAAATPNAQVVRTNLASAAAEIEIGRLAPLVDDRLLLDVPVDARWAAGPARFTARPKSGQLFGTFVMSRPLNHGALPRAARALVGRNVAVFSPSGQRCEATVTGLALESRFQDWSAVWAAEGVMPEHETPATLPAAEAWPMGRVTLVAALEMTGPDDVCEAGRLGVVNADDHTAATAGPRVWRESKISGAHRRAALRAFRRRSSWHEVQRYHVQNLIDYGASDEPGPLDAQRWDEYEDAKPDVRRYVDPSTRRGVVVIVANSHQECGGPGGSLSMVLKERRAGSFERTPIWVSEWIDPIGIVDADGDGQPEIMAPGFVPTVYDGGGTFDGESPSTVLDMGVPDFSPAECPC